MTTDAEIGDARDGTAGRLFDYLDSRINPVLLRDIRLYTRGRALLWGYFFTLGILTMIGISYALSAEWGGHDGGALLYFPSILLCLILGAFVPNLVGERFRSELSGRAIELALASPLSPARLVRGKLLGAWCLDLLVLSTAAPIFATAYLLGGVTVWGILGLSLGVALCGLVMPLPQMYLATRARRTGSGRILFGLMFACNIAFMYGYASFLHRAFIEESRESEAYLVAVLSLAIFGLLYAQLLYFVTVSRLRGIADNREVAPRTSLTIAALTGGVSAFVIGYYVLGAILGVWLGMDRETLATCCAMLVSVTFCTGVELLLNNNTDAPAVRVDAARRGRFSRFFLSIGAQSLAAYFILHAVAIMAAGLFDILDIYIYSRERLSFAGILLCPLMAMALGMVVYFYIVRPSRRVRAGPSLLANTVIVANLILGVLSVFFISASEIASSSNPLASAFLYGGTPVGIFLAAFGSTDTLVPAVRIALAVTCLLLLLLVPPALGVFGKRGERDAA